MSGSSEGTSASLESEKISASASEKEDGAITHAMKAALGTPERLVGRIVTIKDGVSGIEPHSFVNIDSYEPSTETFAVRNLSSAIESETSSQVKLEHLDYDSHPDFCTQYPQAPTVKGCCDSWSFPKETIVDFTEAWVRTDFPHPDINILHSCRTFGAHIPSLLELDYSMIINNSVPNKILVETENDTDIVEFENLLFMYGLELQEYRIRCNRGITIFRNCTFHGNGFGVLIGSADNNVHVRFENCCFQHQRGWGLLVNTGQVTMVQCTFQRVSIGICVRGTGALSVHHTNMINTTCGMLIVQNGNATIRNCNIKEIRKSAIKVANGATANIHQCTISNSACDGIIIEGGDKGSHTKALVEDCYIDQCAANGIRIGFGVVDAEVVKSSIVPCTFGIYIAPSAIGNVALNQCTINSNNRDGRPNAVVDISGDKCYVCVDGILNPPGRQLINMQKVRKLLASDNFFYQTARNLDLRAFTTLGILEIPCQNCELAESKNEVYRLCGQCKRARYCSRACQKEHWKDHKSACGEDVQRNLELSTKGFITCCECNASHLPGTDGANLTQCSRCCEAFYCSAHSETKYFVEFCQNCAKKKLYG